MRQIYRIAVITVLITLIIGVLPASALAEDGGNVVDYERIIIHFEKGASPRDMDRITREIGGKTEFTLAPLNIRVVSVPRQKQVLKTFSVTIGSKVSMLEPDLAVHALDEPNDEYFSQQWGMKKVEGPNAWDITQGSPEVSIAILDTGIDTDHEDLLGKVTISLNFSTSATTEDIKGHGTHVAGIAAANSNNIAGVAGLAMNSSLMNIKVLNDYGSGYLSDVARGVIWAADNGADVINMSLGGSAGSATLQQAIDYAWSKGVVIVAAAGNSSSSNPLYPAYYENCIAVAASDSSDRLYFWSNYGDWVDVAAPGSAISTTPDDSYGTKSGTSMAAPHVAGLAGLVCAVAADENGDGKINDEVRFRIESGSDVISNPGVIHGRINAFKAASGVSVGTVSGTITDSEDGTPISDATVSDGIRSAVSSADGAYTLDNIPEGSRTIKVTKSGYQENSRSVVVMPDDVVIADFALVASSEPLPGSISGTVIDASSGLRIAGAKVDCGTFSAVTDDLGRYQITGVPAGNSNITASADGYTSVSRAVIVEPGANVVVNFSLPADAPSSGTMWIDDINFNPDDTSLLIGIEVISPEPAAGAQVIMSLYHNSQNVWNVWGRTDSHGVIVYRWRSAEEGIYKAKITMLSHDEYTWDKTRGITSAEYILVRDDRGEIAGTVTDTETSTAIGGVSITGEGLSALTDDSGSYTISSVPAGSYTLTAAKEGYQSTSTTVTVVAGETTTADFTLSPIVNHPPVLTPIGDSTVEEEDLLQFEVTASDPDGNELVFSVSNLPGGASFDADSRIFSWVPQLGQAGDYNVTFSVSDGQLAVSEEITITVVAKPICGEITGMVADAETGEAIGGVAVTDGGSLSALTDESGQYILCDVPAGACTLTAVKYGYRSATTTVEVKGGETVTVDYALSRSEPFSSLDSLEYDGYAGYYNAPIHVSGDIYAVAYKGGNDGSDGWLKTFSIDASGEIGTVIDSLEFEPNRIGEWVDIVHVAADIHAIVWSGPDNQGKIGTVSIDSNGNIGEALIDSWVFEPVAGIFPRLALVGDMVCAIAYADASGHGNVNTLSIGPDGIINKSWIDTLQYETAYANSNAITHVSGSTYAIAYTGPDSDGWVATVTIDGDGTIANSVTDRLEFDTVFCQYPEITNVAGGIYAVTYLKGGARIATFTIGEFGDISALVDSALITAGTFRLPDITTVEPGTVAIVYNTAGRGADGFMEVVPIDSAGIIGEKYGTWIFDDYCQDFSEIFHVSENVFCICYEGASGDGYAMTIRLG